MSEAGHTICCPLQYAQYVLFKFNLRSGSRENIYLQLIDKEDRKKRVLSSKLPIVTMMLLLFLSFILYRYQVMFYGVVYKGSFFQMHDW